MYDVISVGELLIDFTPVGISEKGNPIFERNPGGGPANMACAVANMGGRAAFVGKVGNDNFGSALKNIVEAKGVDVSGLVLSEEFQTTLAFVHLSESGDRSFSFYRRQGADTMLRLDEVDTARLEQCRFLFMSTVMMTEGPSRETSMALLRLAREKKLPVVLDPNLRLNLWPGGAEAKEWILKAMGYAEIVKISEEELYFLSEGKEESLEKAAKHLMERFPMRVLMVTLGPKGCYFLKAAEGGSGEISFYSPTFDVKTIDTTAAGDSFTGGFLYCLTRENRPLHSYNEWEWKQMVRFANAVGSLTTTRKGSISALPDIDEVKGFLEGNPPLLRLE